MIAFGTRDLSVRYPRAAVRALDEVTISVPEGCFYAVLGPNGSGKSTLMRALLGQVPLEQGEALVEGQPVREWSRRRLAQRVGVVSQRESTPFPVTVRALVEMGRYPHLGVLQPMGEVDREAVQGALERCAAVALAGRDVSTLSGGEFQRVRIARALAQKPASLVLDEPTSSLDIRHEMGILELLRASADSGMTVFLVTHHLNLAARYADRILLLDRGRVAAEGTAGEVYREEILERVYGWPVAVSADPHTGSPAVTPLSPPGAGDSSRSDEGR